MRASDRRVRDSGDRDGEPSWGTWKRLGPGDVLRPLHASISPQYMIDYNVNDRRDASERSTPATRGMVDIGDYSGGIVFEKNMGAEESLDVVEKLFVACRFTEAATVSSQVLLSLVSTLGRRSEESTTAVPVVNFGDDFINPVGECDVADLIVAVLLQCGYELRRKEDWGRCRAFYSIRGPMPFDVAILW